LFAAFTLAYVLAYILFCVAQDFAASRAFYIFAAFIVFGGDDINIG
jgi:hypothetical protein